MFIPSPLIFSPTLLHSPNERKQNKVSKEGNKSKNNNNPPINQNRTKPRPGTERSLLLFLSCLSITSSPILMALEVWCAIHYILLSHQLDWPLFIAMSHQSGSRSLVFGTPFSLDLYGISPEVSCIFENLQVLLSKTSSFTSSNRT